MTDAKTLADLLEHRGLRGLDPLSNQESDLIIAALRSFGSQSETARSEDDDPVCWWNEKRRAFSEAENLPGPDWVPLYRAPPSGSSSAELGTSEDALAAFRKWWEDNGIYHRGSSRPRDELAWSIWRSAWHARNTQSATASRCARCGYPEDE